MRTSTLTIILCWFISLPTWGSAATHPTVEALTEALTPRQVEMPTTRSIGLGKVKNDLFQYSKGKVKSPSVAMRLEFELNSANLTSDDTSLLDNLGKSLERETLRGYIFELEGHTCDLGTEQHNLALSRNRALAVKSYLVGKYNIHEQQLKVSWFGETKPAALNKDEAGRKQNRRVVVVNTLKNFDLPIVDDQAVVMQVNYSKDGSEKTLVDGDLLKSNQQYVVKFKTNEDLYVYLYQIDSTGEPIILFPNKDFGSGANPVAAGTSQRVPEVGKWFYLDKVVGEEQIILAASKTSIEDPISAILQTPESKGGSLLLTQVEPIYQKTRGLGGVSDTIPATRDISSQKYNKIIAHDGSKVFILQNHFSHR